MSRSCCSWTNSTRRHTIQKAFYSLILDEPANLLDRFTLRGRGGTVLQPGFDRLRDLAHRGELPAHGPVLVVTDGWCEDKLETRMDHAYLLADGRRLPFIPRGEVFYMTE
jgi:hypothetical protein